MIFFGKRSSSTPMFFLLLLYILTAAMLNAQGKRPKVLDSLKHKSPEELVDLIKLSEPEEAEIYENAFYHLQDQGINLTGYYLQIGRFFYSKENYERSINYLNKAIVIAKASDDTSLCRIYLLKGKVYLQDWKNQNALDAYYDALDMAQRKNNPEQEIIASSGIAIVLRRMKQLDQALKVCRRALALIDKTSFKNAQNHVNILTIISETHLDKSQYDSVLYYAGKGITISKSLDYKKGLVDLYIKKGIVFYYKENYDEAFDFLLKAEAILLKTDIRNSFFQKIYVNYFMASCFYKQNSYGKAIGYLQQTIALLEDQDLNKTRVIDTYLLLANCYKENNDTEKALYWYNEYMQLKDNSQEDKDKTISKIHEKEVRKYENQIEDLKTAQLRGKKITKYVLIASAVILLGLLVMLFNYFRKQKSNKILFKDLVEKINRLEAQKEIHTKDTTRTIVIDDDKINEFLKRLDKLEQQEYFLSLDCNLRSMAKKVKTNATYLSKIINLHKEKNFNEYINDLRIDYVLKRLKNDKIFRSFSIKAIATEIGYKSDYSFAKHFKSKTGLNPSYYIKNIGKLNTD